MILNENIPISALERRIEICRMLEENARVLVPELCDLFDVSPATIRCDLRELEADGQLRRTHGGAISLARAGLEPKDAIQTVEHIDRKKRIAAAAANLVKDGDTIALGSGSTMLELARCLANKKNLIVVTNDLQVSAVLEMNTEADIILIGGELRRGFHCTTGPMAIAELRGLNVDKVFLSASAFSMEKGFTTPHMAQAEILSVFMSVATQTIMVTDSSKIGCASFVRFAELSDFDKWYIDSDIDKKTAAVLREQCETTELYFI